jgi:NAD+ kinase
VLTITPICPHALTNRSVVVNATEPIELRLAAGTAEVQVDGMELGALAAGGLLRATVSAEPAPIAFLPGINHYDTLGQKLGWTGDGLKR